MLARFPLTIVMTLLVGSIANAGVMLSMSSNEMRASRTLSLVELANLHSVLDQDRQDDHWDQNPGSNLGIIIFSTTSFSLTATVTTAWSIITSPQQVALMELSNQGLPPNPDLDGLLKPPRLTCSFSV